ncbi:DNA mismatch repair protein MutS [Ginsengibacter hankyongi]|uniref:DNA mismatch repair protein MutS n=1 Tax=Ginsengibacter hankyongi TaxID=2607284 RepID=A0A5J5IL37_9BACT|nr:DNA mismatch repair protein MutS [Ginsengibacter hankyongi]KAA9041720.1 DNA mismatch repair protein MutS [Ginsengibacter hankyongi]
METDKTTLNDLAVFQHDEEFSIFHKLNFTRTVGGREKLRHIFSSSLKEIVSIQNVQKTLQLFLEKKDGWPLTISNGSVLMIHKFYESSIDQIPARPTVSTAYYYKIFHAPDFSLVKYSMGHAFDFIKGMQHIIKNFMKDDAPENLKNILEKANILIEKHQLDVLATKEKASDLSMHEMLALAHYIRYHFKQNLSELIEIYYQLDAWYGMALAIEEFKLVFPTFIESSKPDLKVKGLYHILLNKPVAYDLDLDENSNFVFLTGANMAGKSTFIKAVGGAVFLAHIGMGVPAKSMELCLFDGLLSNINVVDNVAKGESYFYNEVQRIKNTILKINDGRKWLILIDELFKGTNVLDAMKCSTVVIEGLIKIKGSLFILSTHLYEIAESLKEFPNIKFKYFETNVENEQLSFNYNLKDGISNDRLGYLILKREKVIDLLEKL